MIRETLFERAPRLLQAGLAVDRHGVGDALGSRRCRACSAGQLRLEAVQARVEHGIACERLPAHDWRRRRRLRRRLRMHAVLHREHDRDADDRAHERDERQLHHGDHVPITPMPVA
jgi:hypothetical protein